MWRRTIYNMQIFFVFHNETRELLRILSFIACIRLHFSKYSEAFRNSGFN